MPSCEPTISPLNDNEIDFRISFDESDDEDYTVIYDENSLSYKIISINKTDSKNDNKVNMPSFLSPEPEVSYSNDLDYFKYFENEFPAIIYNDALTSKLDFLIEPSNEVSPAPSLPDPEIKQLTIKLVGEHGFVIRPSIGSSNVQPSDVPYLHVLCIGMSQSRQHDKSESVLRNLKIAFGTGGIVRTYLET
ncbi:hypothetical protein Tco_1033793 [Tanacetum coccineum]